MTAEVADGCVIDSSVQFIRDGIVIGAQPKIYRGGEFLGPIQIRVGVFINRDSHVRPNLIIGDRVNLGPFVRLITDAHSVGSAHRHAGSLPFEPILIGDGAWTGAASTVIGGATVSAGAVVAAGAVVILGVPEKTLVDGVPALVIRALE